MNKVWVHKSQSYQEVRKFERDYYLSMTPSERLDTMQFLRAIYSKMKKGQKHAKSRKGLRRVITVIQ